jgi:hypothetical protein
MHLPKRLSTLVDDAGRVAAGAAKLATAAEKNSDTRAPLNDVDDVAAAVARELGRAVQVDSIKPSVESAYGFSA